MYMKKSRSVQTPWNKEKKRRKMRKKNRDSLLPNVIH